MTNRAVIRFGGICLAGGALAFLGVLAYLAARFNYPAVFDGPAYLGNYIGEFLGELSFNAFFLLTSVVWLQSPSRHRWIGWVGVGTALLGLVGMFRNLTGAVAPIAALNNYLLPAFMIVLGVALVRWPSVPESAGA